jgi:ABC-type uncharacterized transport system substrate-binding protein
MLTFWLRDLMPGASLIGVLLNPKFPAAEPALRDVEAAAKTVGVRIQPKERIGSDRERRKSRLGDRLERRVDLIVVARSKGILDAKSS